MKRNAHIPPVHKKVKKNELWFPYSLIIVLICFIIFLCVHTFNVFPNFTKNINLGSIAGAFVAFYALVWQIYLMIKGQRVVATLGLEPSIDGKFVTLSCSITNSGTKSIYPYMVNLYIDEGVFNEQDSIFEFDTITNHTIDRGTGEVFDCHLAQKCKTENVGEDGRISFPDCQKKEFLNCQRYCHNLRQLSHYTLVHIMPGEVFREDVVMKIEKEGVYRATIIYTGKDYDDCICATRKFRIKSEGAGT